MCGCSSNAGLAGAVCCNQTVFNASWIVCCRQKLYSSPEVRFGQGWLNSAAYVSAAHFHANIERSEKLMAPLPSRVLQESDRPPNIADLSAEENHALHIFGWMNSINQLLGNNISYTLWFKTTSETASANCFLSIE